MIYMVCLLSGCGLSKPHPENQINQKSNIVNNNIELLTYQKTTLGSRAGFILGVLKTKNGCLYIGTKDRDIALIFPNNYFVKNNSIYGGTKILELGQTVYFLGHGISINKEVITERNISTNKCLEYLKNAWLIGQ